MTRRRSSSSSAAYRDTMSEAELQAAVVQAATATGSWLVYHTLDSRGSGPGFPDLILLGYPGGPFEGYLYAFEFKSARGKPTAAQLVWIGAWQKLAVITEGRVGAAFVRPWHLDDVLSLIVNGQPHRDRGLELVAGNGSDPWGPLS